MDIIQSYYTLSNKNNRAEHPLIKLEYNLNIYTIGTPTYKIIKFLVPILSCLTINEFTVKDSFSFAKEIVEQDSSFYMGNLDVDLLFTNIPLEETISICTESVYDQNNSIEGLNKSEFK